MARPARALWAENDLLQSLRALAEGRRVGPAHGRDYGGLRRRRPDDRQHFHPGAPAGCDPKKGGRDHCLGRSRGGLTTKIHAVVDRQGRPVRLGLTAGQAHDAPAALALLDRLEPRTILLGDKAYDGNAIRNLIEAQGAVPNIPAKSNRKWKPCFSKTLYRERNQVERFFSKLKHFRRIATRYDKLADNFLAMVKLASMRLWLRAYESTA
jgi:transposase